MQSPFIASLARALILTAAAGFSAACLSAEPATEPGAMLRSGEWGGGVGTFIIPAALRNVKTSAWPTAGWYRLTVRADRVETEWVPVIRGEPPSFLKEIVKQIDAGHDAATGENNMSKAENASPMDSEPIYLRVPGTQLRIGSSPVYRFQNGTPQLRPILGNRYNLSLGAQEFSMTIQNGLRNKKGVAYGEGAQVTIEYDGKQYEYSLGEYGWDTTIQAIADLDGDGKPDFIISVGVVNGGYEAILLSSMAKPGKNPPTASLRAVGC